MFDEEGDFLYEHDLEDGLWDGHSYDCSSPTMTCDCGNGDGEFYVGLTWNWIDEEGNFHDGLEDEDYDDVLNDDDSDSWTDLATYVHGR